MSLRWLTLGEKAVRAGLIIFAEAFNMILTNISKKYMIKILPILHWPKGTVKSSFFFEKDG
ncbi:hypothetical protein [Bacillus sp. NTK034]|uniref:hypothetical protein n=1 Tax=Bacillus sp. NTK034 TaxID=2802176 RepID=UPI001A8F0DFC|nr:hypothetical protein [Bacillus sp. NTK034]MBN8203554.1 hypothetical protein [Bacillus sp. NTK034]